MEIASFFTSFTTLICCALPFALVSLGFGAVVVSMVSAVPILVPLSQQKGWVFAAAGGILAVNAFFLFRSIKAPTADCNPGTLCDLKSSVSRAKKVLFWTSMGIYMVALFMAYLALPVFRFFGF